MKKRRWRCSALYLCMSMLCSLGYYIGSDRILLLLKSCNMWLIHSQTMVLRRHRSPLRAPFPCRQTLHRLRPHHMPLRNSTHQTLRARRPCQIPRPLPYCPPRRKVYHRPPPRPHQKRPRALRRAPSLLCHKLLGRPLKMLTTQGSRSRPRQRSHILPEPQPNPSPAHPPRTALHAPLQHGIWARP